MNPKVEQLLELFENNRLRPAGIRFFFIDDKIIHRHVSRYSSSQYYADEFGYIKNLSLERGQVLNVFAKLEEFVNEFIYLKFIDPSAEKEKIFYELAQKVDFGLKIRLLKEWQIVSSGNLSRKIEAINDVKQQLLYIERIEDVLYKRQSIGIPDVFEKFKEHLLAIIHDIRSLGSEPQTEKSVTVNSFELPLERGSILNKFIELERLLNESLYTRFLLLIAKNITVLDNLLELITFRDRVTFLKKWGIIESGSLYNNICSTSNLRNQLAHIWNETLAFYKKVPISDPQVFEQFKTDFKEVFESLIRLYKTEQNKVNFDAYIDEIIAKLQNTNRLYTLLTDQGQTKIASYPICPNCSKDYAPKFPLPKVFICECGERFVTLVKDMKGSESICCSMKESDWQTIEEGRLVV